MNMHGSTLLVLCCEVPTPDPTVMGLGIMTRLTASCDGSCGDNGSHRISLVLSNLFFNKNFLDCASTIA